MTTYDFSYASFETNSYNALYAILNNRSNISDPRGSTTRTMIYDADPILVKGLGFAGFPYIILELPTVEESIPSVDGRYRNIKWKWKIIIRTARDGSANTRVDVGRSDVLTMADALHTTLNSMANRAILSNEGFNNYVLTKTTSDVVIIDQKMLYEAVYTLTTYNRHRITA